MTCCDRCAAVYGRSYELSGDGDGVEFLTEIAQLVDGCLVASTVVFIAPGMREPS